MALPFPGHRGSRLRRGDDHKRKHDCRLAKCLPEVKVWLISTLLFPALHVPNVILGLPMSAMPIQVLLTFIFGSGMQIIRRTSGTLNLPMVLHGLWDSSLFLSFAMGVEPSAAQNAAYPLAIARAIVLLLKNGKPNDEARNA